MRLRSRFVSMVAIAAMVTALLPVIPASGGVISGGAAGASAGPSKSPEVTTRTRSEGVIVTAKNLPREVTGFDVYRSDSEGSLGSKLNDEPVKGQRYFDRTADSGKSYFYTVKVAGVDKAKSGASASAAAIPDALPQVESAAAKARKPAPEHTSGVSASAATEKAEKPAKGASAPAAPEAVAKMATQVGTGTGVTTLTAGATWTPSGGPYFIRNDVVVPAGKTLTIMPGTKVYFDTTTSGDATGTPFGAVQSVTTQIDLIVHGKIVAKGTSASPIVFTSINSLVESGTANYASAGDWGTIFTDSMSASEVSYCQVEFSILGVWGHNTSRPYVSNSTFRFTGPSSYPWGAVSFTNPKTDATTPRIRITNNTIAPSGNGEGIDVLLGSLGTNTTDRVVDPYIVGNRVTGPYPLEIYCNDDPYQSLPHGGKYGNVVLKGTIAKNTFISDDYAVYLEAYAYGAGKSATISTAFSGNTFVSSGDSAVYAEAESDEVNGAAYVKPTFSKDKITSTGDTAAWFGALADSDVETSAANAYATPTFTSCQIRSTSGDAVGLEAEANGKGTASASAVFSGGSIQSTSDNGVDAWADSEYGMASTSPSFTNVTGRAWDANEFLYATAYTGATGLAKASPKWVGGTMWAQGDDGIYAYAESDEGSAEARPSVSATEIRTYGDCVYSEAYASNDGTGSGNANASATITDSDLISTDDDALYGYADAGGTGNAVCSPSVKNSALVAEDYYGMELYAYSDGGAATCSPAVTDSTMWGYYPALYTYAYRSGDGTKTAAATSSPKLTRSTAVCKYDDAVQIYAYNYGVGNATVKPTFTYSDVVNSYDYDGMYAHARTNSTGTAEVSPVLTGSNVKADETAVYLDAQAYGQGGVAKANGTFTDSTMSSSWYEGLYAYAYSDANMSEVKPTLTGCAVEAPNDYALEFDAQVAGATGKSAVAAPTVSGGRIRYSDDGIGVWGYSWDGACPATVTVAPVLKNLPVVSVSDYGIYTWAYTQGTGDAVNNSVTTNCSTTSNNGIINEALCTSGAGNAYNNAKTLGTSSTKRMRVESFRDYGVYNYAYSSFGNAYDRTQTKYLNISAYDGAVYSEAQAGSGAGKVAHSAPVISGNVSDMLWGADDIGYQVYAYAGSGASTATVVPTISSNRVSGAFNDGIYVSPGGSGASVVSPSISGNTVLDADGNGIYVYGGNDAGGKPSITKNTVTRPRLLGIYLDGIEAGTVSQNKVMNPGWGYDSADDWNSSCLAWYGADPSDALVRGNMFVGARGSAIYYDGGAAKTNYNSFTDCYGSSNRPFNYKASDGATSSVTPYDARYNWWGSSNSGVVASTIDLPNYSGSKSDIVNYSSQLKYCQPRVTKIGVSKTATKVKFTVTFDRPMDKAITTLKFATSSPYSKFAVKGKWNSAGTVFTGTRSRSGLPTGKTMYFSGAKDLPGNLMYSKSKGFKL